MRIGPGALGPGAAFGPSRAPAAVLAMPGGPAVDLAVDGIVDRTVDLAVDLATELTAGLAGTLRSWTGRLVRTVARDVVAVLRRGGPVLVALLTGPRAWPVAQPAVAGIRPRAVPSGSSPVDGGRTPSRIPAPRAPHHDDTGPPPEPTRYELALPADPTAPGRARALLQDATRAWSVDDDVYQDAALVVTELVANAVDHACTPSTLTLELTDDSLRVAVRDARPGAALRALPVDPSAARGRGLQMIDALAEEWGVTPEGDGKSVWAVLPRR